MSINYVFQCSTVCRDAWNISALFKKGNFCHMHNCVIYTYSKVLGLSRYSDL